MPANIIYPHRNQGFLLPPSLKDWLPEDHLVWFVLEAVQNMDLAEFHASFREDGSGGAGYDPSMMVALYVYSYSLGVLSSRAIQKLCECDIAYRVICGNLQPDHTTIARFRQRHEARIQTIFAEVLRLCREAGLTKLGTIAIDGTKVQGNASLAANKTEAGLEEEVARLLQAAKAKDAEEDALYGSARGDELPPELRNSKSRLARIQECLASIHEKKRLDEEAKAKKAQERQEKEKASKKSLRGRKPKDDPQPKAYKANVTDPESRILKGQKGYVQGYNAQAVANTAQIIVAAEVVDSANDQHLLHPMVEKAVENLAEAGETELPKVALADAGYTNDADLKKPLPAGIELIAATQKDSQERALNTPAPRGRIPHSLSPKDRMSRKLRTQRGKKLYKKRGQTIEPVFGQIKGCQRLNRFSRRGKSACDSEWKLICAAHNLKKLWRHKLEGRKPSSKIR